MNRSLALLPFLACGFVGSTLAADSPQAELASRAWAVTETVLTRHVDPPTRQQMLLAGIRSIGAETGDRIVDHRLALQVSNLANLDQLAALLANPVAKFPATYERPLEEVFLEGILSVVSGRVSLLSSKERKVTESFEANLYVGVQVALGLDEKARKPVLQQILEGGPADLAGMKAGDLIEEIDGVPALGESLKKVIDRLRGEEGTEVRIKASRPSTGEVVSKVLRRGRLPRASIEGMTRGPDNRWKFRLDEKSPIGYIKIKEITGSTPRELRTLAEQLDAESAKALVLDLRGVDTAGFHSTILLADALLDGGVIGRVASSEGERTIKAEPDALFRGWPIAVLTDLASLGEVAWLALALEDNKRATILGGNLTQDDPLVREIVAVNGTDWSLMMPTGRLERGDGKPLVFKRRTAQGNMFKAAGPPGEKETTATVEPGNPDSNQFDVNLKQRFQNYEIKQTKPADQGNISYDLALNKARAILEDALRSSGK